MFIVKVVKEGNRLQKHDINGKLVSKGRFTFTQYFSAFTAAASIYFLPKGFTDNFAGYIISFLGIFIGLFAGIVISMFDKSKDLLQNYESVDQPEKIKIIQTRNYLVIFNGLTSYGILLAISIIILLSLSLLNNKFQTNITHFPFVENISQIDFKSILRALKTTGLALHRFSIIYFLCNFFVITTFAFTSYFSYISSEYKKLKPPK